MHWTTVAAICACAGIVGAFLRYVGKAIWDMSRHSLTLVRAVQDTARAVEENTAATKKLADEFGVFSATTDKRLAQLEQKGGTP